MTLSAHSRIDENIECENLYIIYFGSLFYKSQISFVKTLTGIHTIYGSKSKLSNIFLNVLPNETYQQFVLRHTEKIKRAYPTYRIRHHMCYVLTTEQVVLMGLENFDIDQIMYGIKIPLVKNTETICLDSYPNLAVWY